MTVNVERDAGNSLDFNILLKVLVMIFKIYLCDREHQSPEWLTRNELASVAMDKSFKGKLSSMCLSLHHFQGWM